MRSFTVSRTRFPVDALFTASSSPHVASAWTSVIHAQSADQADGQSNGVLHVTTNRMTAHRVTPLDLVPLSSMRAPSTTIGQPIFEFALDAMAKQLAVGGPTFAIPRHGRIATSIHGCLRGHSTKLDRLSHALPEQA